MKSKTIRNFILGAITAYSFAAIVLIASAGLGLLPVGADVAPTSLEMSLLGSALHASVARHAPNGDNPLQASEDDLVAGAKLYRQMCSRCHGASRESDDSYGQAFYPPAPRLALSRTSYTESEIFWIVKHGIRNTAMPAWGKLLSDADIWQVVRLVRKFDSLPDSAAIELSVHRATP